MGGKEHVMIQIILILAIGLGFAGPAWAQSEEAPAANRLRLPVSGCPVCDLWLKYEDVFLRAKQEVGRLDHGVFYFHHSDDPEIIESLIRFAHERQSLARALETDESLRIRLGRSCGHSRVVADSIHLEVSTSARGALAILRSTDETYLSAIRKDAELATLSQVPAWY